VESTKPRTTVLKKAPRVSISKRSNQGHPGEKRERMYRRKQTETNRENPGEGWGVKRGGGTTTNTRALIHQKKQLPHSGKINKQGGPDRKQTLKKEKNTINARGEELGGDSNSLSGSKTGQGGGKKKQKLKNELWNGGKCQ